MRVLLTFAAVVLTLVAAFALYRSSLATREFERRVQALEQAVVKTRSDVSVLRAERAHLARPQRIEELARRLGLQPMNAGQYVRAEDLPRGAAAGSAHGTARRP